MANVRFEGNRFYKVGAGLLYQKTNPHQRALRDPGLEHLFATSNALRFAALPPAGERPPGGHEQPVRPDAEAAASRRLSHAAGQRPGTGGSGWTRRASPRRRVNSAKLSQSLPTTWWHRPHMGHRLIRQFTVWINGERVRAGGINPRDPAGVWVRRDAVAAAGQECSGAQGRGEVPAERFVGPLRILVQLTYSSTGGTPTRVVSNPWWQASLEAPTGWQQVAFDDNKWPSAKVKACLGRGPVAGQSLIWDSVVRKWLPGYPPLKLLTVRANYRDRDSREGFPVLEATPLDITLPTDPTNDAEFLTIPGAAFPVRGRAEDAGWGAAPLRRGGPRCSRSPRGGPGCRRGRGRRRPPTRRRIGRSHGSRYQDDFRAARSSRFTKAVWARLARPCWTISVRRMESHSRARPWSHSPGKTRERYTPPRSAVSTPRPEGNCTCAAAPQCTGRDTPVRRPAGNPAVSGSCRGSGNCRRSRRGIGGPLT